MAPWGARGQGTPPPRLAFPDPQKDASYGLGHGFSQPHDLNTLSLRSRNWEIIPLRSRADPLALELVPGPRTVPFDRHRVGAPSMCHGGGVSGVEERNFVMLEWVLECPAREGMGARAV